MKTKTLLFASLLAATMAAPAFADTADPKAPTTQQQRMKHCNAEAKRQALKGEDRRSFMSTCLRKDAPATATRAAAQRQASSR